MLTFANHINILLSCVRVTCGYHFSLSLSLSLSLSSLLPLLLVCVCVCVCVHSVDRALDFVRVNDESAGVLSPSYDLPYSYMAGVAEK